MESTKEPLKIFLNQTQLKYAKAAGYIINEQDGTMTLQVPYLERAKVIVQRKIPHGK